MKLLYCLALLLGASCYKESKDTIVAIQIQDRNGLIETISTPDRLENYERMDFLTSQPYKKILRIYRNQGKNYSKITTYHPNGTVWQYLEAEELRAKGAYREWFANGQQRIEAVVIGGSADVSPGAQKDWLFHGTSFVWDDQGHLIAALPYNQGSLHGISVYYFPSGTIEKEWPYQNHVLEGIAVEYHPNGQVRSKISYKQGYKDGISRGYFQNGQTAWEEMYKDNLILQGTYYNPKGELMSEIEDGSGFRALFEGDHLSYLIQVQQGFAEGGVKQFTNKGELQGVYYIKNGKKYGTETIYYLPSEQEESLKGTLQPKVAINWEDNNVHGSVKTWYINGQLQSQKDFCRNKKMGPSIAWYRDGSLMLVEEYEEDKLMKGIYYKKNGLDSISSVIQGNGLATLYDENGVFLRKVPYIKGEAVDPE